MNFHFRSAGACPPRTVAETENIRSSEARMFLILTDAWRGTGPRTTETNAFHLRGEGQALALR